MVCCVALVYLLTGHCTFSAAAKQNLGTDFEALEDEVVSKPHKQRQRRSNQTYRSKFVLPDGPPTTPTTLHGLKLLTLTTNSYLNALDLFYKTCTNNNIDHLMESDSVVAGLRC